MRGADTALALNKPVSRVVQYGPFRYSRNPGYLSLVMIFLVVLGVFVMTVGVYGILTMPDTYTRLHAASKMVFLGVISLLTASLATGEPEFIYRVTLIGVFLILTTPV